MKRALVIALALAISGLVGACNTIDGIGKDVERGGEKLQQSSKDVQKKM